MKSIFVSYDTKSDWTNLYSRLQKHIFPALVGLNDASEWHGKIREVRFVEAVTDRSITKEKEQIKQLRRLFV